ncbi:MAG: polyprenyl synthetase family protein [Tepidisphaeraceae bacterium]
MNLVTSEQLGQIESHLSRTLQRLLHAEGLSGMNRHIRDYVLCGGKRVRPQLCVWTFDRVQGSGFKAPAQVDASRADPEPRTLNPQPLLDIACAWELFHAFLLAHDDIIDSADVRRDQPSLHRRLEELDGHSPKFGTNLGIVAGDLLFSAAMRLWHELDVPADVHRDLLRTFSRIACLTGFGQAIDICQSHAPIDRLDEGVLLREYHWKTAAYTFEGPMLSGAILAGSSEEARAAISRFALALGQAYQLQNDLLDLAAAPREGSDLVQGKRTVTLARARGAMTAQRRRDFDKRLEQLASGDGQSLALAESLRTELRETGAFEHTRELIDEFLETARDSARDRSLRGALSAGMGELLDSLTSVYFTSR